MADYFTAEPLFDWETGDFVLINGRPRIAIGKERIKSRIEGKAFRVIICYPK